MNVQRLINYRRVEFGLALREEGAGQHVEIARDDHVCFRQFIPFCRCLSSPRKDLPDALKEGSVCRAAKINIGPLCRRRFTPAHHEAGDGDAIICKSPDTAADRSVPGVMPEIGDAPWPRARHGLALHGWFRDPRIS